MKPKTIKKMLLITTSITATAAAGYAIYRYFKNKKKDEVITDEVIFTEDLDGYFDPWEIDNITDACKRIIRDTGDCGPFTADLSLSQVDDVEETDDYVIIHSKTGKDYKITLSRTINQNDYIEM